MEEEAGWCNALLLRMRCRQCPALCNPRGPPHLAQYSAQVGIPGHARLCHILDSCAFWWPKRSVPKGATYDKPVHHSVNQPKSAHLQTVAEEWAGHHCALWGSCIPPGLVKIPWTNPQGLCSLIHSIRPSEEILAPVDHQTSTQAQGDARVDICGPKSHVALGRATSPTTLWAVLALQLEKGAILSCSTITVNMFVKCLPNKQVRIVKKKK